MKADGALTLNSEKQSQTHTPTAAHTHTHMVTTQIFPSTLQHKERRLTQKHVLSLIRFHLFTPTRQRSLFLHHTFFPFFASLFPPFCCFQVGEAGAAESSCGPRANTGPPPHFLSPSPEILPPPSHLPLSSAPPAPPALFLILATLHLCNLAQSGLCYFYTRAGERAERAGGRVNGGGGGGGVDFQVFL